MKHFNCAVLGTKEKVKYIAQVLSPAGELSHDIEKWKWKLLSRVWLFATPWTV